MFFTFYQNNSFGVYTESETLKAYVIIQADSAQEANWFAQDLGIYFDGADTGEDCPCCGDRWYRVEDGEGTTTPTIYGGDAENYSDRCSIFYKNGVYDEKPFNGKTAENFAREIVADPETTMDDKVAACIIFLDSLQEEKATVLDKAAFSRLEALAYECNSEEAALSLAYVKRLLNLRAKGA
jgi:hypothetical protein